MSKQSIPIARRSSGFDATTGRAGGAVRTASVPVHVVIACARAAVAGVPVAAGRAVALASEPNQP